MNYSCRSHRPLAVLLAIGLLASCSGGSGNADESDGTGDGQGVAGTEQEPGATVTSSPGSEDPGNGKDLRRVVEAVELLPLHASEDQRIVDSNDSEVLLRGVNVTSLGEYWQGDADHLPTEAMTEEDWAEMAANGMSVVRLVISWSRVEPERGVIDEAYLEEIDSYVSAAAEYGIYTVIDMHQDAYTATISTKDEAECPEGASPAKGWDGAPEWATITDGLNTCITGDRNSSPAVVAAWNHFYGNTDGIRERFSTSWAAVAEHFAGRPEVAGYDLLNEPEVSRPAAELTPDYDTLVAETVTAIRQAEKGAGAEFDHLIFVEPAIPAGNQSFGIVVPDPARIGMEPDNIVGAPHNYAESITTELGATVEKANELYEALTANLGVPLWIGEMGWWSTDENSLDGVRRLYDDLDRRAIGGAWWQWRQVCGDPHSVPWGGWEASEPGVVTHLHERGCPGDEDLGPTEELLEIVGRSYPRVIPGRAEEILHDAETGQLSLRASDAPIGGKLVLWVRSESGKTEQSGLSDVEEHLVDGGRMVTATVDAETYEISVS